MLSCNHARDLLLKPKVLAAELFITQHSLARMFDGVKIFMKNEIGRQFIYNRVPVKPNERTKKQIKQNRFLKTNWGKKSVVKNNFN